ncbi:MULTISPECIES: TetR/AcrR family transcriptional regulator [Mycolicibacterium]|uniref:TetR family transcriptional regulator n=1 Tax=Mycolicibacterium fortuitum subsp. fortuitum DSM 46621 = ATCC 6841 = JCM 6387 TaxID=1214102 RepID=K0VBP9_MYCFO|nr:TetR/AcrR family transcriptional regulator [Mycolicibacterium fortuitum]CRL81850.1 TetR family transcriptional regulator [Mycolicibacter nonchromogenicus]AMD53921.1 TetR family transcriptional regulator [Mycolicibacterium fortuitum subsp. fortuitum DSM 46621 = ATCC 6841 = JCM 6387]EJZ08454.1 TetR family transcriptional regulator [Mycolicibacterium fortuitum subsp. fortuitum DSM 46621 = ATCC 6841 = JCM 6387]MBP3085842.1 TetR/AcrR family transcriptional regulator [Mycolicibacterium fortuitum]
MARISPRSVDSGANGVRRRPKDRKAQIARASAESFSALGYHGVSMEAIASRVGISAAALYRHYSSKYELFRDAVLNLSQQLVDGTAFADEADGDPRERLRRLVAALSDTALANRESGGLYRWEARYLRGDDQSTLDAQVRTVHRRIHRPLMELRPELSSRARWTLSTAVLGVIGSVVDHRSKLPAGQIRALLADICDAVLAAELPEIPAATDPAAVPPPAVSATKYEALLTESMRLFNQNGYRDTTMEDIAAAVGMPASGIYRYFSGKSDILAAGFRRAADRLSADMAELLSAAGDPEQALGALIDDYVARSFDHPELDYVYYTERLNMTPADQKILRDLQRAAVESWVEVVMPVRPNWSAGQARFAVHAAMALVIDLGRLMNYQNSEQARAVVAVMVDMTLLGRYRLRTALPAR